MDIEKQEEVRALCNKNVELAEKYFHLREEAGIANTEFDILLTAELPAIRQERKGIGYDMACLVLMEDDEVARNLYKEWKIKESQYKGLEKLMEAYNSKIIMEMALSKHQIQGEKYGS